jgi:hypothetical protein
MVAQASVVAAAVGTDAAPAVVAAARVEAAIELDPSSTPALTEPVESSEPSEPANSSES